MPGCKNLLLGWFQHCDLAHLSRKLSAESGGGSPLRRITEAQAHALQDNLQAKGCEAQVYIGMRYWHPFTEEAIARIKRDGIEELVILPLLPAIFNQYQWV